MKRCPRCEKNRVSIGRDLCDSCHRYQTHSEGIEKQWEKVAQSRRASGAGEKEPDASGPIKFATPWRILGGVFVIGFAVWYSLGVVLSLPSGVAAAEVLWEAGVPFAGGLVVGLYLILSDTRSGK